MGPAGGQRARGKKRVGKGGERENRGGAGVFVSGWLGLAAGRPWLQRQGGVRSAAALAAWLVKRALFRLRSCKWY